MKKLLLVPALIIAVSCTKAPVPSQQQEEIAVLDRAEELVGAEYHRDFGKWWDMMKPSDRNYGTSGGDTKEEFVKNLQKGFENFRLVDYDSARLIIIGEKYAVTQTDTSSEIREDGRTRTVTGCEKTLWFKLPGGWYWHQTGLDCNYLPGTEELERLTDGLR